MSSRWIKRRGSLAPGAALAVAISLVATAGGLSALAATGAPGGLPATGLSYVIDARFEPGKRRLTGRVTLSWRNPSGQTIDRCPLHLYLNAFSHEGTTWLRSAGFFRGHVARLLRTYADPWGYTELRRVRQLADGAALAASHRPVRPDDGNEGDRTLVEVALPRPVPAGGTLRLEIDFVARLPLPIARTGGHDDYFLVAQWFPKLGAFEPVGVRHRQRAGWAARQFHGPTEFYANFADYDVTLRLPGGFVVGATGQRVAGGARATGGAQVLRYVQRAVHDFAFVAGRNLVEHARWHRMPGGRRVRLRYLLPRGTEHQLDRWRRALEGALDAYCRRIGPYPYRTLTVVFPPWRGRYTAGMEYPTLITAMPGDTLWDSFAFARAREPEATLIHELGHQYFYGLIASDEQQDAFLDEGLTTYWQVEGMRAVFGDPAAGGTVFGRRLSPYELIAWQLGRDRRQGLIREAVRRRPAALFYPGAWRAQIYLRGALTLATAARRFGQRRLDRVFASYYQRFAFAHPDPEDLLAVARDRGGAALDAFLREALARRDLPDYRVDELATRLYQPPRGRLAGGERPLVVTDANRGDHPAAGLPSWAREADGRVSLEVTDPGWVRADDCGPRANGRSGSPSAPGSRVGTARGCRGRQREGRVYRLTVVPASGRRGGSSGSGTSFHESVVRLVGPGWDHLPVTVAFEFGDGVVVHDRWDGRSSWRGYRFVRPAPLLRVRIDPERKLLLDVHPENNARQVEPDRGFAADWGLWLSAAGQWLIGALSTWL